jgi:anti-anti-sigma factor
VNEQLTCTVTFDADQRPVLRVRGEVDLSTVEQFRAAAIEAARRHHRLVIDVENAMFLDATGLRVLDAIVREARDAGRPAPTLRGVRPLFAKLLKLAGIENAFDREPARAAFPVRTGTILRAAPHQTATGTLAAA